MDEDYNWYRAGFIITYVLAFISGWIYCIAKFGFLLGFMLGWAPAAVAAVLVALVWPLSAVIVVMAAVRIVT